jgi:uncharacterized membrane protein (UPF0127 family)
MPGQALVTTNGKQWTVSLATTPAELVQGLGGLPSIPPGTGMLFDLGADQPISVTTDPMLFPIDIVFISSALMVTEVEGNLAPGHMVTSSSPARFFLEVNAGEASHILPGMPVGIQVLAAQQADVTGTLVATFVNLMVLMMLFSMFASMARGMLRRPEGKQPLSPTGPLPLLQTTPRGGRPTREDVEVGSWVERDRIGIWITDKRTDKVLLEWWDEDAAQMLEDGFFKAGMIRGQTITGREFEDSVLGYAEHIGVLERPNGKASLSSLPQTIERGDVVEVPFKGAPAWVQQEWKRLHPGSVPRVRVYRTIVARIGAPVFEYAVRDIVAHKAGRTMSRYVPSYESLLAATPEEKALYFGGAVKLGPDEAVAVMNYWGDRFKSIDLYVHPAAYEPPQLVAPTLTDRQMRILATIRAYTSKYRKGVFQANRVTQAELDELQRMGLIDRRGAITVMGRNVVGRERPLESLPALMPGVAVMPRLPEEARKDPLFVEYIRDLVRLGEKVTDEETRRMWEAWKRPQSSPRLIGPRERRKTPQELEFFADSCDHCAQTVDGTGLRPRLEDVFREAIERARGLGEIRGGLKKFMGGEQ